MSLGDPSVSIDDANAAFPEANLPKNNPQQHIRSFAELQSVFQERILTLSDHIDQTMAITSGGRGSHITPSLIYSAAINIEEEDPILARKIMEMPIIFLDLQDHPPETLEHLNYIHETYGCLNFKRFTFDLEDSDLKSRVVARIAQSKEKPVQAFLKVTKVQLLYSLLNNPDSPFNDKQFVIAGNRFDQSKSRADLTFIKEQNLEDRTFRYAYPIFDFSKAEAELIKERFDLPDHPLPASEGPSVTIGLDSKSAVRILEESKRLEESKNINDERSNRINNECGLHIANSDIE